ncbi:hypothetical protein C4J81_09185 [Deltaproteobacteria bacterium Smac51]|nr:hypothetical protein C4J81_09185 [Deltaproteobacteria bacterium Smac51]
MRKLLGTCLLIAAMLLPLTGCGGFDLFGSEIDSYQPPSPEDHTPAGLVARGQYSAALEALQPGLRLGEPEAVFYVLTIRKNGLDGRAANPEELRLLWDVLILRSEMMRQGLRDSSLSTATKNAYRTALAQLAYFGSDPSIWPPQPPADQTERDRAAANAVRYLSTALSDFTPAMNFMAYLYLEPSYQSPSQAYAASLTAAERGDFLAMGNMAWLLRGGVGVEKNDLRAAHWARQGCQSLPPVSRNQNEMGYVYEAGLGVTADLAEAAIWYGRSAAQGHQAGAANALRLKKETVEPAVLDDEILF